MRLAVTALVVTGCVDGRDYVSWIILATAPLCIFFYPANAIDRIVGVVYGLLCPFALLSASYEPLFYLILAAHFLAWPVSRYTTGSTKHRDEALTAVDVSRAAFFVSFTRTTIQLTFRIPFYILFYLLYFGFSVL